MVCRSLGCRTGARREAGTSPVRGQPSTSAAGSTSGRGSNRSSVTLADLIRSSRKWRTLSREGSKLARYQAEGVADAVILSRASYPDLRTQFAVCAGTYPSRTRADQALQELKAQLPNLTSSPYVRPMRRTTG